ncbi:MAG: ABC transporter permease [Candidatus Limnocylindrales bacterium]
MEARTGNTPAAEASVPMAEQVREFVVRYGVIAITIFLIVFFVATEDTFRKSTTLLSVLKYASVIAIGGLGVTTAMVVGGIDLSIGGVAGMAVTISAMTMVIYNQIGIIAIAAVLISGAFVGLVNAFLIVRLRIPDMLATLAVMFVVQGAKLIFVNGQSVSSGMPLPDGSFAIGHFTPDFLAIDAGFVGPIPMPVMILIVITLAMWVFLTRTRWGRILYAIGANPEATRLAGISVSRYRALAYVVAGLLAAVAGLILSSRIGQGDISAGNSLLLDSVAVALVGMSVMGLNLPNAWGTTLGAILLGTLVTGLTIAAVPYYAQDVVKGLVLVVALIFSFTLSRKKARYVSAV